jgi:hypothetical protein
MTSWAVNMESSSTGIVARAGSSGGSRFVGSHTARDFDDLNDDLA